MNPTYEPLPFFKKSGTVFGLIALSVIAFSLAYYLQKPKSINIGQAVLQGDVNGDGVVDIIDFQLLSNSFGKSSGQSGFNINADFNHDNVVDILDFQILSNNFGNTGTTTVTPGPTTPVTQPLTPTPGGSLTKILFTPSPDDIGNPERGFMKQFSIFVDQPPSASKVATVNATDRLVWIYFRLDNYRDPRDGYGVKLCSDLENCTSSEYQGKLLEPLGSGKGLDTVKAAFDTARAKGLKLVIRFMYNFGPNSNSDPLQVNPDMPLSWVLKHTDQLKPLLTANEDVIAAVQIGYVGHFGEWHSSKYLNSLTNKKAVIDSLLTAVPKDRMLQIRYPRYKQLFYGGPITESQAYNQSDVSRIGLFDDAFLKDDTDDGTFKSTVYGTKITTYCDGYPTGETQCWRDFVNKDERFAPVGTEAGTHNTTISQMESCPNALLQLANMHWTFLHNGYAKVVLDGWTQQGCMPEIRRRLGYRLELKEVNLTKTVSPGRTLIINGIVKNTGFGSIYNPRPVYLILTGPQKYEFLLPGIDPRRWEAGAEKTFSANVALPTNIPVGTYKLALWLPDQSTNLRSNPDYSVRFANINTWDSLTGLNILTASFQVQ